MLVLLVVDALVTEVLIVDELEVLSLERVGDAEEVEVGVIVTTNMGWELPVVMMLVIISVFVASIELNF